ncbi:hypothetical protein [Leucobacter sp. G161]|uniref:hypothetical protein n=1 Tax=Leucobacter sp. G161 TaxID=663704 RepID=UPI00073CDC21|nr:hypothetical protein [Leucobacter sp. G161]KUF05544.1 hypothetical protein AUL38_04100 [Leucobacter sp. G161]
MFEPILRAVTTASPSITFELPLVQVLASALITAGATWATIHFTLRHAETQASRAILHADQAAQRAAETALRLEMESAITAITVGSAKLRESAAPGLSGNVDFLAEVMRLGASRYPHAQEVAVWVEEFTELAQNVKNGFEANIESGLLGKLQVMGPSQILSRELLHWLEDPDVTGQRLGQLASLYMEENTRYWLSRNRAQWS